jgi:hypothetical protein
MRAKRWMARQMHMRRTVMKTNCGTYNLILAAESDEKGRSIAETLVYALLILSAVASIISAAVQPVVMPSRVAVNDCKTEYCA